METKFILLKKTNNLIINKSLKKIGIPNNKFKLFGNNYKTWKHKNCTYVLFGHISSYRLKNNLLKKLNNYNQIKNILINKKYSDEVEGRYVIFKFNKKKNSIDIWTDHLARSDIYYSFEKSIISSDLEIFLNNFKLSFDNDSLAHSLIIYGGRPAKKNTIYKNIYRLSKDETANINLNLKIKKNKPKIFNTNKKFNIKDLNRYSELFLNTIKARSSSKKNIVLLSSGWDSTSILAGLCHLYGPKSVVAIIGRMYYAKRSKVINSYEISRAKKIAKYFKVKLEIFDWSYYNKVNFLDKELKFFFKNNQFFSWTAYNLWNLLKHIRTKHGKDNVIFSGEISDGSHNLGFSQYVTIFHPSSYDFREYSDKMNSYLFGPTFFNVILNNKIGNDPVWNLFKNQYPNTIFEKIKINKKDIKLQFLSNFFLRPARVPFYDLKNIKLIFNKSSKKYSNRMEKIYLKDYSKILKKENLYSIILDLYNSFHWQGSTVNTLEIISDKFGLKCEMPFIDSQILKLLAQMPENFGRGLDLKNTKYPLKWMLKNKIDYPFHLQQGPHSYTYDVNPTFTHPGEVMFGSAFKKIFRKNLINNKFIYKLDPKYFNLKYINKIKKKYLYKKEFSGNDMTNLFSVCLHAIIL